MGAAMAVRFAFVCIPWLSYGCKWLRLFEISLRIYDLVLKFTSNRGDIFHHRTYCRFVTCPSTGKMISLSWLLFMILTIQSSNRYIIVVKQYFKEVTWLELLNNSSSFELLVASILLASFSKSRRSRICLDIRISAPPSTPLYASLARNAPNFLVSTEKRFFRAFLPILVIIELSVRHQNCSRIIYIYPMATYR